MSDEARPCEALPAGVLGHDDFCRALARAIRAGGAAVLLVTRCGADAGEQGRWLRTQVRAGDSIGTLGDAGFAVLPAGADLEQARVVARRLAGALHVPVGVTGVARTDEADAVLRRLCAPRPIASTRPDVVAAD